MTDQQTGLTFKEVVDVETKTLMECQSCFALVARDALQTHGEFHVWADPAFQPRDAVAETVAKVNKGAAWPIPRVDAMGDTPR